MTLRIAFMGTPDFAVPTLAELIAGGHDIACVYSQPPRPGGRRGLEALPGPVHAFALGHGLQVRTPLSLKDAAEQAAFAALDLDAAVVVAYGLLLPGLILDAPRLGCINLHGSLLPRWRGAAPIQRAVMAGDAQTGVMTMQMDAGLDTGPVLLAERIAIGRKTSGEVAAALSRLGADLMARTLAALERGGVQPVAQAADGVTYARKIAKDEARIDWQHPAQDIDGLIRGLAPSPGAWTLANGERVKILDCLPTEGHGTPGTLLDDQFTIACKQGAIRPLRLQRPGKAPMDTAEFQRGFALAPGSVLG